MILPGLDRRAVTDAPSPEAAAAGGGQERLVVSPLIGEEAGLPPLDRRRLRTSLRQFLTWSREHFDLLSKLEKVPDGRAQSRTTIPLPAILLALLFMFWLRMGSIRALDDRLKVSPGLRRQLAQAGWSDGISDDTFADALERTGVEAIRDALRAMTRRVLKRWRAGRYKDSLLAKQLAGYAPGLARLVVRIPVAIDGHETFTCTKRDCELCLTRKVKKKVNGVEVEVEERYHRVVSAQWVGSHPAMILDFEPIHPKEGEQTAAYRLVERLAKEYGQAIGTLIGDALYDSEPFRRVAGQAGYWIVVRQKNKLIAPGRVLRARLNLRDPERLQPDGRYVERHGAGTRRYRCWEEPDPILGDLRFVETQRITRTKSGKQEVHTGACLTTIPAEMAPPVAVAMLMQKRWFIESGFHELAGELDLDRAYVHDGRPNATVAIVGLAFMAYNALQAFLYRALGLTSGRTERTLGDICNDFWESLGEFPSPKAVARAP